MPRGSWRCEYSHAGLYDLRLRVSRLGSLVHINEFLYYDIETDFRKSGEKMFDYVDPKNREVQIEMEKACTSHLKAIGAYLPPVFLLSLFLLVYLHSNLVDMLREH